MSEELPCRQGLEDHCDPLCCELYYECKGKYEDEDYGQEDNA